MAQECTAKRKVGRKVIHNPLQKAITDFALGHRANDAQTIPQLHQIPKRYTQYGTLLILGPTFLTHSPEWERWYRCLTDAERAELFKDIARQFRGNVTNIAANAPIALVKDPVQREHTAGEPPTDNVMRSPDGLVPLYGDFGPDQILNCSPLLSSVDFELAYWAETIQLPNITQVWAPRWTMFSRGNISEKARILQNASNTNSFPGLTELELNEKLEQVDVVDFYIGIGYFAFCYLSRGVRRVWGWEINGWSIEGLRRGCLKNGWNVKVVRIDEHGNFTNGAGARSLVRELHAQHAAGNAIRCIAFWGDNIWVTKVMGEIAQAFRKYDQAQVLNIRHCNLGLLPTSQRSWQAALSVLGKRGGWLHVHENTAVDEIEAKQIEIIHELEQQMSTLGIMDWKVECEHAEKVKTYAPGVVHCVFDMKVYPSASLSS